MICRGGKLPAPAAPAALGTFVPKETHHRAFFFLSLLFFLTHGCGYSGQELFSAR